MRLQPTASRSDILLHCSRPFGVEVAPQEAAEAPRYGLAFHALIARLISGKTNRPADIDKVTEKFHLPKSTGGELAEHVRQSYRILAKWLVKNPWGIDFTKRNIEVEKSYAFRVDSRDGLTNSRKCKPPDEETHVYPDLVVGEVGGTADLIADGGPLQLVLDHKTGTWGNFSSPGELPQLRTLALAVIDDGPPSTVTAVLHADRQGIPMVYAEDVSDAVLRGHAKGLGAGVARIGDGSMNPGPWCRYCPAKSDCPTQTGEVLQKAGAIVRAGSDQLLDFLGGDDTSRAIARPADIGRLHMLLGELDRLSAAARKEIRRFVEQHPSTIVERPDGKHLGIVKKSMESLSKSSVLRAYGKFKGESVLKKLRDDGAIETNERDELHALD